MAIKILWTLEGTEKILSDQEKVAKKGEEVGKRLADIGKGGVGVDKLVKDLQDAGLRFDEASEKSIKLGGSLKLLSASMRLIGGEGAGALAPLARIFGSGGLIAGGAIVVAGAAVSIGKLEESFARLQGQLADAFGSTAKGNEAFLALNKQAQEFGSSVTDLAPGLESLQKALNNVNREAKGFVALRAEDLPIAIAAPDVEKTTEAYSNFLKLLRAGRLDQDAAEKSAKAFFDTLEQGGTVTSQALRALPVGTIKELQQALGAGGLSQKQFFAAIDAGAVSVDRLVKVLASIGPQAQKAFDSKAIQTMGDEFRRTVAILESGFTTFSKPFSDFITTQLRRLNDALDALGDAIERAKQRAATGAGPPGLPVGQPPGTLLNVPLPRPRPEDIDKVKKGFIDLTQTVQNLGGEAFNTGQEIAQGMNQAAQATAVAQERFDEFGNSIEEAGRGGQAFKGRLNQIPVFVPQLAGQGGQQAGEQFGNKWVDAAKKAIEPFDPEDAIEVKELKINVNPQFEDPQLQQMQQALDAVGQRAGTSMGEKIKQSVDQASPPTFQGLQDGLAQAGNAAVTKAQEIWNSIQNIFNNPIQVKGQFTGFGGIAEGAPFAAGGQVRGPGSGTSDSILAFLSNREWVVNAKAVDFYGSNLFAALNSMRLPRNFVMPRFAEGGQVKTEGRTLTLVLGGREFALSGSKQTISNLEREASLRGIASLGPAPGFVR